MRNKNFEAIGAVRIPAMGKMALHRFSWQEVIILIL